MPTSKLGAATRAFVSTMLSVARCYALPLGINRDSSTEQLRAAFRKLLLKVHPDKGGSKDHTQKLQAARGTWDKARKDAADNDTHRRSTTSTHTALCAVSAVTGLSQNNANTWISCLWRGGRDGESPSS